MSADAVSTGGAGELFVVATPIGNLEDLSPRAAATLARVDRVLVEDRRHAQRLLQHLGLHPPTLALHEHNERELLPKILTELREGALLALISDAGMPLISDPGFPLLAALRRESVRVTVIPGPSAVTAALALAGLPSDRFCFEGFLPAKSGARRRTLERLKSEERTLVFYEAPHRIIAALEDLGQIFGADRPAALCRELSKLHEECLRDDLGTLLQVLRDTPEKQRGEMTLVVAGAPSSAPEEEQTRILLRPLLAELPLTQAVRIAEAQSGLPHRLLYQTALALTSAALPD
ncbi:MAG: 16S rRNA (cytidine(1402)-2'-O)-methyltransferase [Acidithiobacillus sp.]